MADRSIVVRLRAEVGNFRSDMQAAATAATATGAAAEQAGTRSQSGVRGLMASAQQNEQAWNATGNSLLLFGGAVVAGVGLAIHKFAEFDQAMSEVKASTHETSANMDLLREAAISAGADTAFSAKEAAQGIDELAKAGVSTKDILAGGLTGALSLAAAGSLGVGDAAEIAATALTQFKLAGKDIPHVADLLAAGAGKAQGSVQDMGMALKQSGLVASQVGLTIEETTGGLAAFASAGLVGSDAGTSFKSMLQRLTPQSKEAQDQMDALGLSAYDSQGNFIGLAAFSGQLKNSMKDLDSESRNAAMGVIFGSDAVRAANVFYEQGATGVQGWIDAVNETGFAAQTAAIKQDNLAGDIEKLGGSFDTVLIKGGEGAAQSLRGVVQATEGLVDMLGKIPAPVLNTGMAMAATVGGVALLAGGFMKMVPAVASTITNFQGVFREGSRMPSVMGKVGKAVGIATAALLAFEVFNAIAYQKRIVSLEEMTSAILKVANAADGSVGGLDAVLGDYGKFAGKDVAADINGVADAVARITKPQSGDGINRWADQAFGWTGLAKSETTQVDDRLKQVGDSLGALAKNGGADAAAKAFKSLSAEFVKNGSTAQDALDHLPGYTDALRGIGNAAGLSLDKYELLDLAEGKIPARLAKVQAAQDQTAASTEAASKQTEVLSAGLNEIGVSATGAITNLDAFTQSLVAAGLLTLSSRDAARAYKDTLDSFAETIAKNGANLDINTKAGRDNEAALDAIAKAGISAAEAMAKQTDSNGNNVNSQAEVQSSLKNTYTDLVNSAFALTGNSEQADLLARKLLGIPPGVSIDTWMADTARQKAAETKVAIDNIPRLVEIDYVNTTTNRVINMGAENHIAEGPGGRGGITRWSGGLVGFTGGGVVPGTPPANPRIDNILAMTQNGTPYGIRSGEIIINEPQTKKNLSWLTAVNDGLNLDDVFGSRTYQAPSKSLAAGYAPSMSMSMTGSSSGGGQSSVTNEYHTHVDAAPGVAYLYAKDVATQAAARTRDYQRAYGN